MAEDHKGFCVRSVKSKVHVDVDIPGLPDFDFSEALESVYPILEIVFSYLSFDDLKNCCLVKKFWKEVAQRTLAKRIKPSWFTYYRTKVKPKTNIFKYSDNLNYNNVGFGLILYDFRRIKLHRFVCLHVNTSELSRKTVPEYLEEELVPRGIAYCLISCPNVVSHFDPDLKDVRDIGSSTIMDGLFIPSIPNIKTAMFHCNVTKKDDIQYSTNTYFKTNDEVKCLLLFSTKDINKHLFNFLRPIVPENEASSVAIGGGIIRGTKTFQEVTHYPKKKVYSANDTFCIAFYKDKGTEADFNAYSYVIHGDDLSKAEFEEKLVQFKNQILLRPNSIGIRICCSAKVDTEDESVLFSKIFPNVPLLGFNADGEIGWNCFFGRDQNEFGESKAKKSKQKYPKAQHQWSTVIVLLTWGTIKT